MKVLCVIFSRRIKDLKDLLEIKYWFDLTWKRLTWLETMLDLTWLDLKKCSTWLDLTWKFYQYPMTWLGMTWKILLKTNDLTWLDLTFSTNDLTWLVVENLWLAHLWSCLKMFSSFTFQTYLLYYFFILLKYVIDL